MTSLTPRQRELLRHIWEYLSTHGTLPTYRELSEAMGLGAPNAALSHLRSVAKKGYVRMVPRRGFRLLGVSVAPECSAAGERLAEALKGGEP